ncbi:MAG: molybdopterin-dependent oxidoreductase, partial [Thermomicrobiales bacterium]
PPPPPPPVPRIVNMVRLGAALNGEVSDPPIRSLYVLNANPVTSTPNSGLIIEGLKREDLFTVVHDLFMTDTAQYADIVLPATTQLEQVDLHKGYGHRFLQFNHQAIEPLGEARSNWDTMRSLAAALGYDDWWLRQEALEVIQEIFEVTQAYNPLLEGITVERLIAEGTVPLNFDVINPTPFADRHFPTPSGKVELHSEAMTDLGQDPLPVYTPPSEFAGVERGSKLVLMSAAAHHFVSSSLANVPKLMRLEGTPSIDINPDDAAERAINHGDDVIIENERGWCRLRAVVTDDVPPGVAVSVKGQWSRLAPGGRNVNFVTPDALADLGNQATFHSNLVEIRPAEPSDVEAMRWEMVPAD